MTRWRLTIARLMAIIILIALGLTALKYALRRPSHPAVLFKRFALVGRIDLNRNNQDDRQELKQIIEEAGGIVEFDSRKAAKPQKTSRKKTSRCLMRLSFSLLAGRHRWVNRTSRKRAKNSRT